MAKAGAAAARAGTARPRPAVEVRETAIEERVATVVVEMDSAVEVGTVAKVEGAASVVGRRSTGTLVGMGRWEEVEIVGVAEALPAAASPAEVARGGVVVAVGAEATREVVEAAEVEAAEAAVAVAVAGAVVWAGVTIGVATYIRHSHHS